MARQAVVLSKLDVGTAAVTINRFCSSGLQSIAMAANQIVRWTDPDRYRRKVQNLFP